MNDSYHERQRSIAASMYNMKQKLISLSHRYVTALRTHLKQRSRGNLQPALNLGRQAVVLGLETLELARIHEQALSTLGLSLGHSDKLKRAALFFAEVLNPIVATHPVAQQSKIDLKHLNETLNQRTLQLADTNRLLQRGVSRRKNVEVALKKCGRHYTKLLKESLLLQEGLRQLTHRLLAAQETERKKISCGLQDEIAQTLLGINVRLLNLKQEARTNRKGLKNEIASTQRLVIKSVRSVRQVARKFKNA